MEAIPITTTSRRSIAPPPPGGDGSRAEDLSLRDRAARDEYARGAYQALAEAGTGWLEAARQPLGEEPRRELTAPPALAFVAMQSSGKTTLVEEFTDRVRELETDVTRCTRGVCAYLPPEASAAPPGKIRTAASRSGLPWVVLDSEGLRDDEPGLIEVAGEALRRADIIVVPVDPCGDGDLGPVARALSLLPPQTPVIVALNHLLAFTAKLSATRASRVELIRERLRQAVGGRPRARVVLCEAAPREQVAPLASAFMRLSVDLAEGDARVRSGADPRTGSWRGGVQIPRAIAELMQDPAVRRGIYHRRLDRALAPQTRALEERFQALEACPPRTLAAIEALTAQLGDEVVPRPGEDPAQADERLRRRISSAGGPAEFLRVQLDIMPPADLLSWDFERGHGADLIQATANLLAQLARRLPAEPGHEVEAERQAIAAELAAIRALYAREV